MIRVSLDRDMVKQALAPEALEAFRQLEAERIAAGEPEPDPESCVEVLARQRRWFASARQKAAQSVDARGGYFPNPLDRETQIEMVYLNNASVGFFTASSTFEAGPPATIEDLVKRTVDAEEGIGARDKLVDRLRDEIADLKNDLFLAGRNKK
jgi:hypothetical protein